MEVKIKQGVPLPEAGGGRVKYPFAEMNVGDSFEFPARLQTSVRGAYKNYVTINSLDWEFTTRKIGPSLCAIWRTK